eukprot:Gb_15177 [translate_table: standard]
MENSKRRSRPPTSFPPSKRFQASVPAPPPESLEEEEFDEDVFLEETLLRDEELLQDSGVEGLVSRLSKWKRPALPPDYVTGPKGIAHQSRLQCTLEVIRKPAVGKPQMEMLQFHSVELQQKYYLFSSSFEPATCVLPSQQLTITPAWIMIQAFVSKLFVLYFHWDSQFHWRFPAGGTAVFPLVVFQQLVFVRPPTCIKVEIDVRIDFSVSMTCSPSCQKHRVMRQQKLIKSMALKESVNHSKDLASTGRVIIVLRKQGVTE